MCYNGRSPVGEKITLSWVWHLKSIPNVRNTRWDAHPMLSIIIKINSLGGEIYVVGT